MKFSVLVLFIALKAQGFDLISFQQPVTESNPVIGARVTDGPTAFTFVVPNGWTMRSDPSTRRVVLFDGARAAITIQISTNAMPRSAAEFRRQIETRFEGAAVTDEFEAPSGSRPGLGIDFRHIVKSAIPMLTRCCVYKSTGDVVEIAFTTRPEDLDNSHPAWTSFINSLRVEPGSHPASVSLK